MHYPKPAIGGTHANASSVRGFRRAQMSRGVTDTVSGFAPQDHISMECVLRGLRVWRYHRNRREQTRRLRLKDGEGEQTRVAAREKEKALGPCELRALLHDEPSSPCTRHGRRRITGHRQTLRSDDASYARALDRAHNLSRSRDEIG